MSGSNIVNPYRFGSGLLGPDFVSVWETSNTSGGSSNSDQVTLPLESGGTYSFEVNWGDGNSDTITAWDQSEVTHTYSAEGEYTITITGTIDGWRFNDTGDRLKLLSVTSWGDLTLGNNNSYFKGCSNLTSIPIGLDLSGTLDFISAWQNCSSLTSFPLLDTSNGTAFNDTWHDCSSLTSFPLLDVSAGTSFKDAWRNNSSLTSFPLLNTSNGTAFTSAWRGCSSLTSFPLLDVSNGTSFNSTWYDCSSLTSFPLLDVSSSGNFGSAWRNNSSLTSFPLLDTSNGIAFNGAWYLCSSLTSFPLLDVSAGTTFNDTWRNNSSLTTFPLLDVSSGTSFVNTWWSCSSLTQLAEDFGLKLGAMLNGSSCFNGVTLDTDEYNQLLVDIESVNSNSSVSFHGGNSEYSSGPPDGESARAALIADHSWTITDGGLEA